MKNIVHVKLKEAIEIAPRVKHFVFEVPKDMDWSFVSGQFMSLHIEHEGKQLRRNYSIANPSIQKDTIEFACAYVKGGLASELLFNLKIGESIPITGPYGIFILKDPIPKHYYLIATGTGVTPYRSMLPTLKDKMANENIKVTLLFGTRTRDEVLYQSEFLEVAKEEPNFKYICCYSREPDLVLESHEFQGYVQDKLKLMTLNKESDRVYLCGNPSMVDDVFAYLLDQEFERKAVVREKYIAGQR